MYIAVKFVTDTHTYIHRDKGTHRARLLSIYLSLIPFKSHHSDIMTRFNRTSKHDTVPLTSKEIFMITISGITLSDFKNYVVFNYTLMVCCLSISCLCLSEMTANVQSREILKMSVMLGLCVGTRKLSGRF